MSEFLDMVWLSLLDRGNHGLADSAKYRQAVTDWIWHGKVEETEETAAAKVAAAREAIGKAPSDDALEQAKALRERLLKNRDGVNG
mgnify:CR=1 FL=1